MTQSTAVELPFRTIGIVGCGLIGCSIAAALRARRFSGRIVGCGRPGENLNVAATRGYIDVAEPDLSTAVADCDLVVVCTPVDLVAETVKRAAAVCSPRAVVTDVGSVKQAICRELESLNPGGAAFIGSHPIAGSEKQGCAHANSEVFLDHVCVLTPDARAPRAAVDRLATFWRFLGMRVVEMTPQAHDRALAQTSHVPHLVAAVLAASIDDENRHLTAGGFQDTTRIASGNPALWSAILLANARETSAGLRQLGDRLLKLADVLDRGDESALIAFLTAAKQNREAARSSASQSATE